MPRIVLNFVVDCNLDFASSGEPRATCSWLLLLLLLLLSPFRLAFIVDVYVP